MRCLLRLYKNVKSFYLKYGDEPEQELKHYTVRDTHMCVIYLFRPDKLVREQSI